MTFRISEAQQTRFWQKVKKGDGCWEWEGARMRRGYGMVHINARVLKAHRVAYTISIGDIPAGLFVCHHCDNPKCVRPDHLFLGTPKDNTRDMVAKNRSTPQRTHCVKGHEFTPENIYRKKKGTKQCLRCMRQTARKWRAKQGEIAA